jgi:mannose-1-phosphate guanylyltransferase
MRGVIIAGGFGTRLRPLTLRRPKPLIPVANRPFLEYQVAQLRAAGVEEIVFATNYLADRIEAHFGDGSRFGVRMRYAMEQEPLGTAGAIRNAVEGLPPMRCIVFNGDILTDFDLGAIVRSHLERKAQATLTLYRVQRPHPYGIIQVAEDGRVQAFIEPSEEQKRAAEMPASASRRKRATLLTPVSMCWSRNSLRISAASLLHRTGILSADTA